MTKMYFSIIHILATINYKKKTIIGGLSGPAGPEDGLCSSDGAGGGRSVEEGDRLCGFLFTQLNSDSERARERPVDLAQSV